MISSRRIARLSATAICAIAIANCLAAPHKLEPKSKRSVAVANFSGIQGLDEFVNMTLSPDLKRAFIDRKLAVFAYSNSYITNGPKNYCMAYVGLTAESPEGRNPRIPAFTFMSSRRVPKAEWNDMTCRTELLGQVLQRMNEAPSGRLYKDIELTQAAADPQDKPANPDFVSLSTNGIESKGTQQAIVDLMVKRGFNDVFDYRNVQLSIAVKVGTYSDGEYVCFATAGLTASTAPMRTARMPATHANMINYGGNNEQACIEGAAKSAALEVLNSPWNATGALRGFEFAREDGVALPEQAMTTKPQVSKAGADAALKALQQKNR